VIKLENLSKSFGQKRAVDGLSLEVAKGEVVVVCGPSGSGKSTLIKCVNGLEPFEEGTITVDGISVGDPKTNLPKLRARIGMVFQHFELFPHMTVTENLNLAQVNVLGRSVAEATAYWTAHDRRGVARFTCPILSCGPRGPARTRPRSHGGRRRRRRCRRGSCRRRSR